METWFAVLRKFVEADLTRIRERGLKPVAFEEPIAGNLDFGEGVVAPIQARFDRRLEGDTTVVGDYKISGNLKWRMDPAKMLKAQALQVPLYRLLAGEGATVELLAVHPDLDPDEGEHRKSFDGFGKTVLEQSFLATMRVLCVLVREGRFPFHSGNHCDWCAYTHTCRRNHPPTIERQQGAQDARAYLELLTKSTATPHGR
jgi:hypothetical protein